MTVADETNSKTGTVKAITMMEMSDSLPSSDVTITQASSSVSVKSHCGSYFDSYIEEHNLGGSCCKLLCVCASVKEREKEKNNTQVISSFLTVKYASLLCRSLIPWMGIVNIFVDSY